MVGCCSVLVAYAASADAERQPGSEKTEFVFERGPTPQCHASTVAETASGLVAAWFGGTKEAAPDVGIWLSRWENGAWTTPVEVADGVHEDGKRFACFNPVLFQPANGSLMLFYKVAGFERGWAGFVKTSADGGRSWSKAKRLPDGIIGPVKNKPVQLPNGDLLSGSSTEYAGWRVHFERSSDQGVSWQASAAVNDPKEIGAIQPAILQHGGGKLQALCRTRGMNKIGQIWSVDGGKTWGRMELIHVPHPSSGLDALTLSDGSHILVYNHTLKGRARLNVATSKDGRNWNAALMLEDEADKEFSYPAVIQTRDGRIHITYTWKRERIKHVVLNPTKLQTRPIVSDEWPQ